MSPKAAGGRAGESGEPACPICGKPVEPNAKTRPFCSSRCKMVDLGRWLKGQYRVPGEDAVTLGPEKPETSPDDDD